MLNAHAPSGFPVRHIFSRFRTPIITQLPALHLRGSAGNQVNKVSRICADQNTLFVMLANYCQGNILPLTMQMLFPFSKILDSLVWLPE